MLVLVSPGKPSILAEQPRQGAATFEVKDEFASLSRSPGLAAFVEEEVQTYRNHYEANLWPKWLRWWRHYKGEYGPEFRSRPGRSDLFVRRTRERVAKAHAKLMELNQPLSGNPWDLRASAKPSLLFQNDPTAAAEGMRRQVRDDLQTMRHPMTLRKVTHHMSLYGTGITFGPFGKKQSPPAWVKILGPEAVAQYQAETRPWLEHVSIWELMIDPNASCVQDAASIVRRRLLNAKQLRELGSLDGFDPVQAELLIKAMPQGNYSLESWESARKILLPKEPRWVVWERWGLVDGHLLETWDLENVQTTGYLNTWTCGRFTLGARVDPLYENELPFDFIPYELQDGTPYGSGPAEHIEDIQVIQNALARGLHDNLADSSMPDVELDMTQLGPDADLTRVPGKTWQKRPNELAGQQPAVRYFLTPNNSPQIIQAWQVFESQVPVATSMPTFENPREMGSAVRTLGMQEAAFSVADGPMRNVQGNVDEFGWAPWIRKLVAWEMAYNQDTSIKGDMEPEAQGVRGAVRRELIAKHATTLREMNRDPETGIFLDNPLILKAQVEGMGLVDEPFVLSPEAVAQKMMLVAQREAMSEGLKTAAKGAAENGIRASTSRADALLALMKTVKDDSNPVWGPLFQQAMESQGAMTPQIYLALAIWAKRMQAELVATMGGDPLMAQFNTILEGFQPQKPTDIDPDYRQKELGMEPERTPALAPDASVLAREEA